MRRTVGVRRIGGLMAAVLGATVADGRSIGCLAAQELGPGAMPIGVEMRFDDDAYAIAGATAQGILAQLRALGPGSQWTEFLYTYRWSYRNVRIPLVSGLPSDHCQPIDFTLIFELTATYPRWIAPEGASEALIEAWADFSDQLERHWAQIREDMVGRGREAATSLRRFEDQCAFINKRIRERVIEAFSAPDPLRRDEARVQLTWPPAGFEHLMRVGPTQVGAPDGGRLDSGALDPDEPGPAEETVDGPSQRSLPASRPAVTPTSDIDQAVLQDARRGRAVGIVLDLHHRGAEQFREAFGQGPSVPDEQLEPDASFSFPSLTEVLIAAVAHSLSVGGQLDLRAPIATYLPDISTALGATTLEQLMDHRAGLDNAMVADTADWQQVMDRLNDRALFTQPGAVFSHSRYSYPLTARVIEAAMGRPIEEVVSQSLLTPLGLTRTSLGPRDTPEARDGLPSTHTTVDEVTRFWTSWLAGEIPGNGPEHLMITTPDRDVADGRSFTRGFWFDLVDDAPRISLMCGASRTGYAAGFQVYPETSTIMAFWSRYAGDEPEDALTAPSATRWPGESVRYMLSRVALALQLSDEVYRPTLLTGGGQPGRSARRCAEPAVSAMRPPDFGPLTPTADWAGRYVNGEWFFDLLDQDGLLESPAGVGRPPFRIRHYGADVYFTDMGPPEGPPTGFPLRLIRDAAGRRYVVLGGRAYLHDDDRPGR